MLGTFLRKRRKELGLGVREIANAAGLTEGAIYMIERGDRIPQRIDTVVDLADAYQVEAESIFRQAKEATPRQPPKNGRRSGKATAST